MRHVHIFVDSFGKLCRSAGISTNDDLNIKISLIAFNDIWIVNTTFLRKRNFHIKNNPYIKIHHLLCHTNSVIHTW